MNSLNDCYFFFYSSCTKGDSCTFRHSQAALGSEVMCTGWRFGTCTQTDCALRHMEIQINRPSIPCYWESQITGCQKPHCPFLHRNPKHQIQSFKADIAKSDAILPQVDESNNNTTHVLSVPKIQPFLVSMQDESDSDGSPLKNALLNQKTTQNSPRKILKAVQGMEPDLIKFKTVEEIQKEALDKELSEAYELVAESDNLMKLEKSSRSKFSTKSVLSNNASLKRHYENKKLASDARKRQIVVSSDRRPTDQRSEKNVLNRIGHQSNDSAYDFREEQDMRTVKRSVKDRLGINLNGNEVNSKPMMDTERKSVHDRIGLRNTNTDKKESELSNRSISAFSIQSNSSRNSLKNDRISSLSLNSDQNIQNRLILNTKPSSSIPKDKKQHRLSPIQFSPIQFSSDSIQSDGDNSVSKNNVQNAFGYEDIDVKSKSRSLNDKEKSLLCVDKSLKRSFAENQALDYNQACSDLEVRMRKKIQDRLSLKKTSAEKNITMELGNTDEPSSVENIPSTIFKIPDNNIKHYESNSKLSSVKTVDDTQSTCTIMHKSKSNELSIEKMSEDKLISNDNSNANNMATCGKIDIPLNIVKPNLSEPAILKLDKTLSEYSKELSDDKIVDSVSTNIKKKDLKRSSRRVKSQAYSAPSDHEDEKLMDHQNDIENKESENVLPSKSEKISPTKSEKNKSKRCKFEQPIYRPPPLNANSNKVYDTSGVSPLLRGAVLKVEEPTETKDKKNSKWGSKSYCQVMKQKRGTRTRQSKTNTSDNVLVSTPSNEEGVAEDEEMLLSMKNKILDELASISTIEKNSITPQCSETQPSSLDESEMEISDQSFEKCQNENLLIVDKEKKPLESDDLSLQFQCQQNDESEMEISDQSFEKSQNENLLTVDKENENQESNDLSLKSQLQKNGTENILTDVKGKKENLDLAVKESTSTILRNDSCIDDINDLLGDVDDTDDIDLSATNDDLLLEMKELLS